MSTEAIKDESKMLGWLYALVILFCDINLCWLPVRILVVGLS
jgi:hypothetical protein